MSSSSNKIKKELKGAKLPNEIIPIKCSDKTFQEHWYPNRNLLNFPHSWRMILIGPPSSGKSTILKNIIMRAYPKYDEITVVHFGAGETSEWDDVGAEMISELPDPLGIESEGKKLLIIEDMEFSCMPKDEVAKLNRLFGYSSSHRGLSIALTCQDAFNALPCCRRTANIFVLWKQPDLDALSRVASRTGLKSKDLMYIFNNYMNHDHASLIIDITRNSPAKLRIDGYKVLEEK